MKTKTYTKVTYSLYIAYKHEDVNNAIYKHFDEQYCKSHCTKFYTKEELREMVMVYPDVVQIEGQEPYPCAFIIHYRPQSNKIVLEEVPIDMLADLEYLRNYDGYL